MCWAFLTNWSETSCSRLYLASLTETIVVSAPSEVAAEDR